MPFHVQKIGVVGSGQMGAGIAQTASQSGFEVLISDVSRESANQGKVTVEKALSKLVQKEKLTRADAQAVLDRINPVGDLADLAPCDLVIEAVSEKPELKFQIFKKLDEVCRPEVVLASNTSSISITEIAQKTKRSDRVAGMHFMNPVPVMKLVEGIRGLQTSDDTFRMIKAVSEKMGKTFVASADVPGFMVNRILMPMINEAVFAVYEGVGGIEDIDIAMKLGTNQPMGPLTLADFIGLDTCLAILNVLFDGLGDPKYRPCPLLVKYVAAGWVGKKSGRGFYKYDV